jgi:hypothetical protein
VKDLFLPFWVVLLPFVVLATANAAGYRYGASDQAFYTPAVMQRLDPTLFPRDARLLNAQADLTFADETLAALSRVTRARLPVLFAALYVVSLALIVFAAFCMAGDMFSQRWTAVALVAAISLRHAIARAGTNTLEGYFHPRQLAFALGALALCAFLKRRYIPLLVLLAGAAALHPTTTLWFVVWLYVATILAEPARRRALALVPIACLPVGWWAVAAGPLTGRLLTMDGEWRAAIGDKDYLFPLEWPAYAWMLNLGYVAILAGVWRVRRSSGALRPRETALVAGCLSLVLVFAVALVLQLRGVALAVQLQPARVFWMLDWLATIYLVWLLAESGRASQPARAAIVAGCLAVFATARGFYIMQVQFPDRPIAQIDVRDDDWRRVMAWARATDRHAGWLADPLHAARYGTSVRVAGARDVFVEALKDSALGMYDRAIAIRTRDRLAEIPDFPALTPVRARELARSHDLDFLVTEAALDLPVAFESGRLRVYRIKD